MSPTRRHVLQTLASAALLAAPVAPGDKPMRKRPQVVCFDVVETLFSLEPLRSRLQTAGLPAHAVDAWYTRLIRDAIALDATGVFKPFREVARAALEVLLAEHKIEPKADTLDTVMAGFAELPAFPDVAPAFRLLRDSKLRIFPLTNGNAELTTKLLGRAKLDTFVERVISIDEIQRWKPNKEVYLHASKVTATPPERLAMVAVHAWDIHGAMRAGLTTGWCSRREKRWQPLMGPADVSGATLDEVCRKLVELPG